MELTAITIYQNSPINAHNLQCTGEIEHHLITMYEDISDGYSNPFQRNSDSGTDSENEMNLA